MLNATRVLPPLHPHLQYNVVMSESTSTSTSHASASSPNLAPYPLLRQINSPADLRALSPDQLEPLAAELRQFIIDTMSNVSGHFAAGLGCVELTVALHRVFNTPDDKLVWDVGHQTYPHKVLTGRRDQLHTIRQQTGLSPFTKPSESEYDTFSVGHSSTSISAALGMAIAAEAQGLDRRHVAIIGDGAMSGGMAFEAMNHGGHLGTDMLVILNDNEMSISENVGAMNNYFARILSGQMYSHLRESGKKVLEHMPTWWELARRSEEMMKGTLLPGALFEELGFNYIGPIDGHDLPKLLTMLERIKTLPGPQFLHIVTQKGRGFAAAEGDPIKYHAVSGFDPVTGAMNKASGGGKTYTQVFSDWLCDIAEADKRIIGITPAMREGSGLVAFSQRFPERYHDVAIAEQHAVTVGAGMAIAGMKPIVAIYSTFLQRGYDQLIHDVAIQNLPVVFAIDRAGLVGPDGPTHAGVYDLSYLRCIPNMTVMAPADENECRQMLYTAYSLDTPSAVRYPRGKGPGIDIQPDMQPLPIGKAEIKRTGSRIALLAFGAMVPVAETVAEQLDATVVNMRFVKPLDTTLLQQVAAEYDVLVTLEDNAAMGGAGSGIVEYLAQQKLSVNTLIIGIPDRYIQHGSREDCLADAGLDAAGVSKQIHQHLGMAWFNEGQMSA